MEKMMEIRETLTSVLQATESVPGPEGRAAEITKDALPG